MLYANRQIGSLYTSEAHRKKGLALAVTAALCRTLLAECPDIPPYCLVREGDKTHKLFEKLGFVDNHRKVYFLYLNFDKFHL